MLSALAATLMPNLMSGKNNLDVLDIAVPPELWLAMGISGGTYAGSKAIKLKIPDTSLINATGSINELPKLNNTFITLLLISNGTYLVRKSAHLIPDVKTTDEAKKNDTKDKPETG